jgi:hypothetical protein
MKLPTYALAFACMPTLAHGVIPAPPQCQGRYHGKLIVRYVGNIRAACNNPYADACNVRFPNSCVIYLPRTPRAPCTSTNTPTVIADAGTNSSFVLNHPAQRPDPPRRLTPSAASSP